MYYSSAVATPQNRTAFVGAVTSLVKTYDLDGIDLEYVPSPFPICVIQRSRSWEYPNRQGIGCNTISSADSANFLLFLQELRQDPIGKNLYLSAAVGITPFVGSDGTPMSDVSAFASPLNHIGRPRSQPFISAALSPTINLPRDHGLRYLGTLVEWNRAKRSA